MYRLPVWDTIGTVYRFIWDEKLSWLKFAIVLIILSIIGPFLLLLPSLGLAGVMGLLSGEKPTAAQQTTMEVGFGISTVVLLIAYIALFIAFMVAWHRHYLLDPRATSIRELFIWKRRHWLFLGRAIVLAIVALILFVIAFSVVGALVSPVFSGIMRGAQASLGIGLFIVPSVIMAICATLVLFFETFLLLSLPAAAIDDGEVTLLNAMRLSRRNQGNLTWVLWFGSFLPFWGIPTVVEILILHFAISGIEDPLQAMIAMSESQATFFMTVIYPIFSLFFSMLGLAVGVSLVSASFRRLRDTVPLEPKPATAA